MYLKIFMFVTYPVVAFELGGIVLGRDQPYSNILINKHRLNQILNDTRSSKNG